MGCVVCRSTSPLTLTNLDRNAERTKADLESERVKRVEDWVAALDRIPTDEQQIMVVEAKEQNDSPRSDLQSEHSESATEVEDDEPAVPARVGEELDDSASSSQLQQSKDAEESDGEVSIGDSEPDMSEVYTKAEVRRLLGGVRHQLEAKRKEEQEEHEKGDLDTQFTKFDLNDDEWISRNEFVKVCKKLGSELSTQALTQVYYEIDLNGDGMLHKEEFIAAFKPVLKPKRYGEVLMDPMVAAEKATPSRPISAKSINWQGAFG